MALSGENGKPIGEMTVLITGGSGGIGGAIAERFASVGMNIVIHYMNSHEAANDVARRCMALGAKVMTVAADMKDRSQL
ncbi:SDR family NAD(P)-dependent oxidoreductase, partial [Paenibacillus sonchi]